MGAAPMNLVIPRRPGQECIGYGRPSVIPILHNTQTCVCVTLLQSLFLHNFKPETFSATAGVHCFL